MSWRVVYIEESEYLSLYLDNIKVKNKDKEVLIPITDIHTIILDNYKINLSVHLINALTKFNVNVISCGVDHLPKTILLPYSGNKLAFQMMNKQLKWSKKIKTKIHKFIVKNKIFNQKTLLKHLNKEVEIIKHLKLFYEGVLIGDKSNREGHAAKVYFNQLFGLDFKRFNDDVINAGLNYGYAILRSQITKVLVGKGLNTAFGFFHIGRENQFNLSDDIIEPFRPIIDFWVYTNLREEKIFLRKHRIELIKQTTKTLIINKKKQTLFNAVLRYVEGILNYCETEDKSKLNKVYINFNEL